MKLELPNQQIDLDKITEELDNLIQEKSEALNTINIAVNEHVRLKNEYVTQSNNLRITTDFKEAMNLSKPATEKQQQSYIDDQLQKTLQDLRIAEENVKSWKREVDLLDDKITSKKYQLKIMMGLLNGHCES